jgi:hypothetical protein
LKLKLEPDSNIEVLIYAHNYYKRHKTGPKHKDIREFRGDVGRGQVCRIVLALANAGLVVQAGQSGNGLRLTKRGVSVVRKLEGIYGQR